MIRRGFWLVLGAVLGVSGYRRAARLARSVLPGRGQLPGGRLPGGQLPGGQLARARLGTLAAPGGAQPVSAAAGFLRDVREGRADYLDRHPLHRGPTLEGQRIPDRHPHETGRTRAYPGIDYAKDGR